MSDIIVRFKPMGQKRLIDAIKRLDSAQKGNTVTTRTHTKVTNRQTKANAGLLNSQRLLNTSFATFRSHMLLASFAMSLGIRQVIGFAKQASKVQQMEQAFNAMSGGVNEASIALRKLQDATDGTLSSFDLFQQANNAMVLGVTKNSDEMAQMFDMAQRLGDALGKDVRLSVESLVTGIGRQSRLMLDNIGIIVKADKAYEDYAREIGKTVATLTDSEKKQAFMNAALEAGREKLKFLPEETLNANKSFQQLSASVNDLAVRLGEQALPFIVSMADNMTKLAKAFNSQRIKAYAEVIEKMLVGAMLLYINTIRKAIIAQTRLGWGALATAAGFVAAEVLVMAGAFNEAEKPVENLAAANMTYLSSLSSMKKLELSEELKKQKLAYEGISPELIKLNSNISKYEDLLAKGITTQKTTQKVLRDGGWLYKDYYEEVEVTVDVTKQLERALKRKQDMLKNSKTLTDEERAVIEENIATLENQIAIVDLGFDTYNSFLETLDEAKSKYQSTTEAQKENLAVQIQNVEQLIEEEGALKDLIAVRDMLKNKQLAIIHAEEQAQLKSYSRMAQGLATVVGMNEKNAKAVAAIQAAGALVDAFAGASAARFNANKANLPVPIPGLMYAVELAAGLANARAVAMAANKVGGGASGGGGIYGKFEQGGYVGGRPHSQGGTIIEAERGEFVMSRNAVESIGLETLNQMNQSGGGASINVNVSGNVLTQDFVEGELAESIKEAVRRGSDFGIG